jgi:uncharacterized MAPEG superfamily protein
VLFTALVLTAVVAGKANEMTLLGAQLFVWARLVYAAIYLPAAGEVTRPFGELIP